MHLTTNARSSVSGSTPARRESMRDGSMNSGEDAGRVCGMLAMVSDSSRSLANDAVQERARAGRSGDASLAGSAETLRECVARGIARLSVGGDRGAGPHGL